MKQHMTLRAVALAAALLAGAAHAEGPEFSLSGFGTLGLTHSTNGNADFVADSTQAEGAGRTRSTALNVDTKLGLQANAKFSPEWSGVVQLISKQRYDGTWTPTLEWANVAWQVTPEVRLRAGRTALPAYAISESRFVGYSQHWVRPPIEVYNVQNITSNDGFDVTWRKAFGSVNNTLQAYVGIAEQKAPNGSAESKNWGLANTVEMGDITLRASYGTLDADTKITSAAFNGAYPLVTSNPVFAQKYRLNDLKLKSLALGAAYDPGNWFVASEFVQFSGDGLLSDSTSVVLTGGMRFGALTPYLTYANTRADWEFEPASAGLAGIVANGFIKGYTPRQSMVAAGVRWDVAKNFAVKGQVERISTSNDSNGRFSSPITTGANKFDGGSTVYTVTADFVF